VERELGLGNVGNHVREVRGRDPKMGGKFNGVCGVRHGGGGELKRKKDPGGTWPRVQKKLVPRLKLLQTKKRKTNHQGKRREWKSGKHNRRALKRSPKT